MKKILALILAMLMCFSLFGCGDSSGGGQGTNGGGEEDGGDDVSESAVKLTFGTGGDQGTYYGYGSVLAQYISGNTDTSVTAVTSGGSQANIEMIDSGDYQLGFVQSDVMSYAYSGTNLFADFGAVEGFSTVAALYMEQVQIVTCDPAIKSVADLAGKSVSIGAAGSGVYYNAIDVLSVYGLSESDIRPVYQSFGDSAESLQDGLIDAAFVVAGAPTTAITSLATSKDVYLIGLDDEHVDALIELSPYYTKVTIDQYDGIDSVTSVAVGAVIIAADSVPEAAIYNLVSTIFENKDTISVQHAKGEEIDIDFASSITDVPYHAGAAKYFAEKGITVPTK